jgi:hypothetical protein
MIVSLTSIITHAEASARLAVAQGDDAHADYMFRVADAAIDLLKVLLGAPA